jgi:hypothetical protein
MSAQFEVSGVGPVAGTCPLCGNAIAADAARCDSCGYHLAGVDGRPGPYSPTALWWTGAALAVVYVLTLLVVLAAR